MSTRARANWGRGIAGRLATTQSPMLWLLGGFALCLTGQLVFHLKLGLLDGLVLYAAGAVAIWRSQRGRKEAEQALPFAPGLLAAPPASRKAMWLAAAAAFVSALVIVLILAPELRFVPVQLLVLGAAALWVWAAHAADARPFALPSILDFTVSGRHRLGLLAVLVVALAARIWDLSSLPEGLWYDEARIGSEAWRILTDAQFRPVYSEGTTTPAAYIYVVSWLEAIFGKSVFAIRMASALAGVVSTVLAYAVARLAFGYRVALIAAALFAVARWDINFSRIAMQGATTPMLTLLVVAAALGALRTGRRSLYALLGVSLGTLVWFYTSNVFMAGVMVVALASLAVTQPKRLWEHRFGLLLAVPGRCLLPRRWPSQPSRAQPKC